MNNAKHPQPEADVKLKALDQVIEKHFPNLQEKDQAAFKKCRLTFCEAATELATEYARRRQQAHEANAVQRRYKAIAAAAQRLRFELEGLSNEEQNTLAKKQQDVFRTHLDGQDAPQSCDHYDGYQAAGEPYKARTAIEIQEWKDLHWLEQGAKLLSPARKRGRPENTAERWVARQFVILCHRHGWSPVRFAHSGTEKKEKAQASDATICLAAILVAGGEHEARARSSALSALKLLRNAFEYAEWPAESINYLGYDSEPIYYTVTSKSIARECGGGFELLPQFAPKQK